MPDSNFDLERGVSPDNLLAVQVDNKERLDRLFNVNMSDFVIPKEIKLDQILLNDRKVDNGINIKNAQELSKADDPHIRKQAIDFLYAQKAKDPISQSGTGFTNYVSAQEGQSKFTNDNILNHNKYGFNPYITIGENEDYYNKNVWDKYSIGGKLLRGVGTFAGRTLSNLVTGLAGSVGDIMSIAWNTPQEIFSWLPNQKDHNFWADVSNNAISRSMEDLDKSFKDYVLPVYQSIDYDKKGAFQKLGDSSFWQNEMADGAGFLLQFAVPTSGFAKLAKLGELGQAGKIGAFMAKPTSKLISTITGGENVAGAASWIFNTTMESLAQTKEGFHKTVSDLTEKGFSKQEAEKIASNNAPTEFGLNMGILSLSSSLENRWFQKLAGNVKIPTNIIVNDAAEASVKKATGRLGKFLTENLHGQRLSFYGEGITNSILTEGYWEENAQLAATRVATGNYTKKLDDNTEEYEKSKSFFLQLAKQTYDASSFIGGKGDKEVADSIMAGAVIGVFGAVGFAKLATITNDTGSWKEKFEGERRATIRETASKVAEMNNLRNQYLSIKSFDSDIYDVDDQGNKSINKEKLKTKTDEINLKLGTIDDKYKSFITADNLTNQTERKAILNNLFSDYVLAHINNGSEKELVQRLEGWKNKTDEELALFGVSKESNLNVEEVTQNTKNLIQRWKDINKIKYRNPEQSDFEYNQKSKFLKSVVYQRLVDTDTYMELSDAYKQKAEDILPFTEDATKEYNRAQTRFLALENNLSLSKIPEKKEAIKNEMEEISKNLDVIKESLPDYQEDPKTGFLFKKGTPLETSLNRLGNNLGEFLNNSDLHIKNYLYAQESAYFAKQYGDANNGIDFYNKQIELNSKTIEKVEKTQQIDKLIEEQTPTPQVTKIDDDTTTIKTNNIEDAKNKGLDILNKEEPIIEEPIIEEQKIPTIKTPTIKTPTIEKIDYNDETNDNITDVSVEVVEKNTPVIIKSYDVNKFKPIAWRTLLFASKLDTKDKYIDKDKDDTTEILRDIPYREMQKSFIEEVLPLLEENKLQFFIEDDNNIEVYQKPFNNENIDGFIPSGEIIKVYKNGTPIKISDVFPDKFIEMANLPLVFPFNQFRDKDGKVTEKKQDNLNSKIEVYLNKYKDITREEVVKMFNDEIAQAEKARKLAKNGIKTEVIVNYTDDGFIPSVTNNGGYVYVKLIDRFTEAFSYKITKEGIVFADFGKKQGKIPVTMSRLKDNVDLIINIDNILNKEFETKDLAEQVRNEYLNVLFNTNKKSKFSIYEKDGKFKIVYRKIESNLADEDISESEILPSKDYENLYININKKALESGMNMYDSTDNSFSFIEAKEYKDFINEYAKTSYKRIEDKDGKLRLFPINQSFSFTIVDNVKTEKEIQDENNKKAETKITNLIESGKLNDEQSQKIQVGLADMLAKQQILQKQYDNLIELSKRINKAASEQINNIEENKKDTLKEKKKLLLNKSINQVKDVFSEKPTSNFNVNDLKELQVELDSQIYTIDLLTGNITRVGITGNKVKINPETAKYGKILLNLAELKPFSKVGGFVEGVFTQDIEVEIDGKTLIYKAIGLPSTNMTEIFLNEKGEIIYRNQILGITEKGNEQIKNFENRYC